MQITVRCLSGQTLIVNVKGTDTVGTLKTQVNKLMGYEPDQLRINFRKQQLKNQRTLSSYENKRNSEVYLSFILKGGGKNMCDFDSLQTSNKVQKKFSSAAPKYRIVTKGLNLQAKCKTQDCQAFRKKVWVQMGFGTFNIGNQTHFCKCPLCKYETDPPTNIGYYMTQIKIIGMRQQGQPVQLRETVNTDQLTTFVVQDCKMRKWNFLEITTKSLNNQ